MSFIIGSSLRYTYSDQKQSFTLHMAWYANSNQMNNVQMNE